MNYTAGQLKEREVARSLWMGSESYLKLSMSASICGREISGSPMDEIEI